MALREWIRYIRRTAARASLPDILRNQANQKSLNGQAGADSTFQMHDFPSASELTHTRTFYRTISSYRVVLQTNLSSIAPNLISLPYTSLPYTYRMPCVREMDDLRRKHN